MKLSNDVQANVDGENIDVVDDAGSIHLNALTAKLNCIVNANEFDIKLGGRGIVRIKPKSIEAYRQIIRTLEVDQNIQFNTYQLREERALRVVVRGKHASTPTQRIHNE